MMSLIACLGIIYKDMCRKIYWITEMPLHATLLRTAHHHQIKINEQMLILHPKHLALGSAQ